MNNNNNLPAPPSFANNLFGVVGQGAGMFASPGTDFIPVDGKGNVQYLTGADSAQWIGLKTKQMQRWAYDYCYAVAAVVDKLGIYDANGKLSITRLKGKGKDDLATNSWAVKMNALLDQPNPFQGWSAFRQQQIGYKKVYGYCPVFPIVPLGFQKEDAVALYNIPPWALNPDVRGDLITDKIEDAIRGWDINLFGQQIRVAPDGLMILQDTYMMDEIMKYVLPKSRLVGLDMPVSNLCHAHEAENVMLRKRGAIGFISYDAAAGRDSIAGALPMTERQKVRLQKEFARFGTSWNQWQHVISRVPTKWNSTVLDVRKLGLDSAIVKAEKAVCHRYGLPYTLFEEQDATYANGENAEKSLYTNNIIPESDEDMKTYEKFFGAYNNMCCINRDFSHISAIQEDEKFKWDAALARNQSLLVEWTNDQITQNEWRAANGRDTITGGDIYYSEWKKKNQTEPAPVIGQPTI